MAHCGQPSRDLHTQGSFVARVFDTTVPNKTKKNSKDPEPEAQSRFTGRGPASAELTMVMVLVAIVLAVLNVAGPKVSTPRRVSSGVPIPDCSPSVRFERQFVANPSKAIPRVTNVQIVDMDGDGANDLLVCDGSRNEIIWYRNDDNAGWVEHVLAKDIKVPAHATLVDIDSDGDQDIVVAVLGDLLPSDKMVGKIVVLLKQETGYEQRVLLDDLRRVADVQVGDFDGDNDPDLAVAVFGYARGEVLWLENRGELRFRDHFLLSRPGGIHIPVHDFDNDGDLDIITIITQEEEEVWGFENDGRGHFRKRLLHFTHNFDIGGAGLVACDLDQDGDVDLLLPQGDNLELSHGWPQPYHGCKWLENQGGWKFQLHHIAAFGGTYAANYGDVDADGDYDVVLVSMINDFSDPTHPSVVWLENNGRQNFTTWTVDTSPPELICVALGDLDGDGRDDIVAGGMDMPFSGVPGTRRLTLWKSKAFGKSRDVSR